MISKLSTENISILCHEVNRAYCNAIGDDSQVVWNDAPSWQKESTRAGVIAHHKALLEGKPLSPEASHEAWLAYKKQDGWVCGKEKDEQKKTHPCMVPFAKLSDEQQAKDYMFTAICKHTF